VIFSDAKTIAVFGFIMIGILTALACRYREPGRTLHKIDQNRISKQLLPASPVIFSASIHVWKT
jgi:hypothetical protein